MHNFVVCIKKLLTNWQEVIIILLKHSTKSYQSLWTDLKISYALEKIITLINKKIKKKPRNSSKKSGKPTGGQPCHKDRTLEKIKNPDEIINLHPHQCNCGCDLSNIEGTIRTRQVFEIPVTKIKIIEYKTHEIECPKYKKIHKTEFPENVFYNFFR